jgi:hypothetical protein
MAVALTKSMKRRSKANLSLVAAIIVVACGRVSEDDDGGTGGTSGDLGTGGELAMGGSGALGSGGKTTALGGTSSGGAIARGGTPSTGGTIGLGGAIAKGGSTTTGGTIGLGGSIAKGGSTTTGGTIGPGGVGGVGGHPGGYVPLSKSSWDVTVTLRETASSGVIPCTRATFTLHVEPKGNLLELISGRDGSVFPGELNYVPTPAPSYHSGGPLSLPSIGDCAVSSIVVNELALQAWDDEFDGVADVLEGTGKATATLIQGDL